MKSVLTWRQILPTLVTLTAMICGFFAILVTVESMGRANAGQFHRWAAQLIMLAMILDGIDGNLARRLKGCSEMGSELDTYVDMTAFGIAPALLIYVVSLKGELVWRVLMTSAVVLSGVLRLARFKAQDTQRGQAGYSGLPITACAAWVATFVLVSEHRSTDPLTLASGPMATLFLLGILAFAVLQVSNVRYPKPTKHALIFVPLIGLVGLLLAPTGPWAVYAAVTIIGLGLLYVIFGPFYMRRVERSAAPPAAGNPP